MSSSSMVRAKSKGKKAKDVLLQEQINQAIMAGIQQSDQEYLRHQAQLFQERHNSKKLNQNVKNNDGSGSSSESETSESCSDSETDTEEMHASENNSKGTNQNQGTDGAKKKKKKREIFDISKPTIEDTEGLIGLDDVIVFLMANIQGPVAYPGHQSKMRPKSRLKGFLAYGPPGCGKTESVAYVSAHTDSYLIKASAASMQDKYIGGTAKNVKKLFLKAVELEKCIIFIDEVSILHLSNFKCLVIN